MMLVAAQERFTEGTLADMCHFWEKVDQQSKVNCVTKRKKYAWCKDQ